MSEPNVLRCPGCGHFLVEPIFDLAYTAAILGIRESTLRNFLSTGPGKTWEARYRFFGNNRKRVLFISEVQALQRHYVRRTRRVTPEAGEANATEK